MRARYCAYWRTCSFLLLDASSTIDFGAGAGAVLKFASSSGVSWASGAVLDIVNWDGVALTGGGTEGLFFGANASGLTPEQLAQIRFIDSDGNVSPAGILSSGEVVAVPEPGTIGMLLLAGAGITLCRARRGR